VAARVADVLPVADPELPAADAAAANYLPWRELDLVELHLVAAWADGSTGVADLLLTRLWGHV